MTWPALIIRAGRQEVESVTEGNSREWRKSHSQLVSDGWSRCCNFGSDCGFIAQKLKSGLATWAPSSSCLKESWNSAGKTAVQQVHGLQAPCTTVMMLVCLGWCNTSSRPLKTVALSCHSYVHTVYTITNSVLVDSLPDMVIPVPNEYHV